LQQILLKLAHRLSSNQRKFIAEVIGTFIVVVFATGSVLIDAKLNGILGVPFIAFAPFVGVAAGVYLFGKISMAQFNPAVTLGFLITRHITTIQLVYYFTAEIVGALFGSLFVKYALGNQANLGANAPNYSYPIAVIFGVEIFSISSIDGSNSCSCVYQRTEGSWWDGNRWHRWFRYILFIIYFRSFYEPCSFASARCTFRCHKGLVALLVCDFYWNFNYCISL
jgi:Major intrinsic protein